MKKQSRTVIHRGQSDSQPQRHLPLVDILVNTQRELQALVVASGLKVLDAMLEEDRVAVCGPWYAHQPVDQPRHQVKGVERGRPIEDHEQTTIGAQPAALEIGQQPLTHGRVLGRGRRRSTQQSPRPSAATPWCNGVRSIRVGTCSSICPRPSARG